MKRILCSAVLAIAVLLILTAASPAPASAAGPAYHVVRVGDTLDAIAWRYGSTTWAIARANGIWNPNIIYVGQVLVIPGWMVPCPGCPYPPPPPPRPTYYCSYRVQYGDTLTAIAWRMRVDVWALARANGIYNLNWIYAGQWLRIPGCVPTY